jgi:hypothetical protein
MSAQPLHAANRTPSLGGGTPGGTPEQSIERSCAVGGRLPPALACTRFNNKTWQEYQTWLSAYQQSYEQIYQRPLKCIYGAPREISHKKIPPQTKILVIEMNNDENKIMGIGEIINQTANEVYRTPSGTVLNPTHNPSHSPAHNRTKFPPLGGGPPLPPLGGGPPFRKIFSDRNYTRYIYIGNTYYASREELERNHTEEAQYINEQLKSAMPQTPQEIQIQSLERLLFKGARHMKRGSGITGFRWGFRPPTTVATLNRPGVPPPHDGSYAQ